MKSAVLSVLFLAALLALSPSLVAADRTTDMAVGFSVAGAIIVVVIIVAIIRSSKGPKRPMASMGSNPSFPASDSRGVVNSTSNGDEEDVSPSPGNNEESALTEEGTRA